MRCCPVFIFQGEKTETKKQGKQKAPVSSSLFFHLISFKHMSDELTFSDLGLSEDILEGLAKKGFVKPTPVQAKTIPLLMSGERDIIGQAQTGTGKTAAFGLPIIEGIEAGLGKVQAIVVAPTRELANQVAEEMASLKAKRKIRILPVYGGQGMGYQLKMLRQGVDVVVGTPGRIIDHLKRKTLKLDDLKYVVLDEADEMLNMGFIDDIEEILTFAPESRRMLLFSATMPKQIKRLAEKFMGDYDHVAVEFQQKSAVSVEQFYYDVYEKDKLRAIVRLIDTEDEFYTLIFCRTRLGSDRLADKLSKLGYDVEALHGDVSQAGRERILAKFKSGKATILAATDVAARGIDVNNLSHVINFDLPDSPEQYVHRIGRTGRAGKTGKAISLVAPRDRGKLRTIIRVTKTDIVKAKLPAGDAVKDIKRQAILKTLEKATEVDIPQEFYDMAQKIVDEPKTKQVVAALLKLHFGAKLRMSSYSEIEEPTSRGGGGGGRRGRGGGGRGRGRRSSGGDRPRFEKRGSFRPKKKYTGTGKPKKKFGKKNRANFG